MRAPVSSPRPPRQPSIRFRPPVVEITEPLRWVLVRAFGPGEAPASGPVELDPARVVQLATSLGLAPRVAARHGAERLAEELGPEAADSLRAARRAVAAADLRLAALAEAAAAVAAERELAFAFLKGFALQLLAVGPESGRGSADLDLLAPPDRANELQAALIEAGFRATDSSEQEHQLAPLIHPSGAVLEVHRVILGVRLGAGAGSVTFDALRRADFLEPAPPLAGRPAWPTGSCVPARPVLVAHALAHGIAQHGWAPHAYPGFRMIADLIDLRSPGEPGPGPGQRSGLGQAEERALMTGLLAGTLDEGEVAAAFELCQRLRDGDPRAFEADPARDPPAALLHHLLAGALDEAYGESLRFRLVGQPLSDRSGLGGAWSTLRRALAPTRAEMGKIYGRAPSRLGYLGRLALRPFDLLARAWRYAASAWRLR